MEILFCSHCQQSIPLKDIQSGLAELQRGKYLCATCREIVPADRESPRNRTALVLGILLVGALAVAGYLLLEDELFPARPAEGAAGGPNLESVAGGVARLRADLEALEERTRRRLDQGFRDSAERLARQEAALALAASRLDGLCDQGRAAAATTAELQALRGEIEGLRREVRAVKEALAALRDTLGPLREPAVPRAAAAPDKEPDAPVEPEPEPAEVDRWLARLGDPVVDKRFGAVAALTRFEGSKVDAALIGCLKDGDFFIRRFVAEELGERKTAAALGPLVDALDDEEVSVREAAVVALRKITGKDFGFRSAAAPRERARAAARWREHIAALEKKK